MPVAPAPIKPVAAGRLSTETPAASSSSSSATTSRIQPLTADTLNAHAQSNPKIDMFRQGGVPKVLEVKTTAPVSDLAARQQRAAENRQRLEDEKKKQAAEQERRRKELEAKRLEADKVAAERRAAEIKAQNDRLEAARARAQREVSSPPMTAHTRHTPHTTHNTHHTPHTSACTELKHSQVGSIFINLLCEFNHQTTRLLTAILWCAAGGRADC